jgi:hypothetical protein
MAFELFVIASVEEIEFNLYTSSTNNIVKQFFKDNGGILLTCCPCQNPLLSLPFPLMLHLLIPLLPSHPRPLIHPV